MLNNNYVNKVSLWLLYKKNRMDLFNQLKVILYPMNYNPVSVIIDIDSSLIMKGFEIIGNLKDYLTYTFKYYMNINITNVLIDGISWVEMIYRSNNRDIVDDVTGTISNEVYNKKLLMISNRVENVTGLLYDTDGNIIDITLKRSNGETVRYTDKNIFINGEERENPWGFVPVVEFDGAETDDEDNISRVENIDRKLMEINSQQFIISNISKLHGDPLIYGNANLDKETASENDLDRLSEYAEGKISSGLAKYINVPEGTDLKFLEMSGNVLKIIVDDKDSLKKELSMEYPEISLHDVMSGSSLSGYAIVLKLQSLISTIERYRTNIKMGMEELCEKASLMVNIQNDNIIEFGEIIDDATLDIVNGMISAYNSKLIDRKTATRKICKKLGLDYNTVERNMQNPDLVYKEATQVESMEISRTPDEQI